LLILESTSAVAAARASVVVSNLQKDLSLTTYVFLFFFRVWKRERRGRGEKRKEKRKALPALLSCLAAAAVNAQERETFSSLFPSLFHLHLAYLLRGIERLKVLVEVLLVCKK